jgi:hypothetical protein
MKSICLWRGTSLHFAGIQEMFMVCFYVECFTQAVFWGQAIIVWTRD